MLIINEFVLYGAIAIEIKLLYNTTIMVRKLGLTIGFTVFLGVLLILSVWGVFAIGKRVFRPSGSKVAGITTITASDNYEKFIANGNGAQLEVQGPVKGNEDFKSYKITITPSERRVQLIRGYDGVVTKEQSSANSQQAYEVFMRSIGKLNFDSKTSGVTEDERGFCPMGRRYIYSILDESDMPLVRTWATSCGNSGNSKASGAVRLLFNEQIPEYAKFFGDFGLL